MNWNSINHRRPLRAVAAGLAGVLLVLGPDSAGAMPIREGPTIPTVPAHGHYVEHGCFVTPHTWNVALAGPLPRCYTYVP